MIDNIKIKVKISESQYNRVCEWLNFKPGIDADKIYNNYFNLRFGYYPNIQQLIIENSIHKFYNRVFENIDGNYTDFTLTQFHTACHYICSLLEVDMAETLIGSKFEFGVNVNTCPYNTFSLICKWLSHATTHINEFYTVPPFTGKPFQRTSYSSDYKIKVYDKSIQAKIYNKEILRYEIVVTEIRKLKQILSCGQISLDTLANHHTWAILFNFLLTTYQQVRKIPQIASTAISQSDITSIYSYCCALMRHDMQSVLTKYHFTKLNSINKKIYDIHNKSPDNFFNELFKRIKEKEKVLIT